MDSNAYAVLNGVGELFIAPVGTAFPALTATPAAPWRSLGETEGGVTVTPDQTIEEFGTDQRTGKVKATRTEESQMVETQLAEATLENLGDVLGMAVTDTPPDVGVIGTREIGFYRGSAVTEYAFLFRGNSPYGAFPAQYQLPRGYFGGAQGLEHTKDDKVVIPVEFHALEDLTAAAAKDRFGKLIAQDAVAV